jgi:hypothetical protein
LGPLFRGHVLKRTADAFQILSQIGREIEIHQHGPLALAEYRVVSFRNRSVFPIVACSMSDFLGLLSVRAGSRRIRNRT